MGVSCYNDSMALFLGIKEVEEFEVRLQNGDDRKKDYKLGAGYIK